MFKPLTVVSAAVQVARFVPTKITAAQTPLHRRVGVEFLYGAEAVNAVRSGLPTKTVRLLSEEVEETVEQVLAWIDINHRTYQRRKELLTSAESEKVLRLLKLESEAAKLFGGDAKKGHRWLTEPALALGGTPPIELVDTESGYELVHDLIGRIEHGVYS